jgi:cation diffusion facilitator family transporter
MKEEYRADIIKKASIISIIGNLLLAVAKITVGLISGSLSVVGDGIDTSVDVLISAMTLFVSRIITMPADEGHPWGHGRAETIATACISFILFFAGVQLFINAGSALLSEAPKEAPAFSAVIVTIISIIGKLLLAANQYLMGRKSGSAMLKANAKNMAADIIISVAVLIGLALSMYFNIGSIDSIAALFVGVWVIRAAIGIFTEVNSELMDGGSTPGCYKDVFDAVHSVPGALNPHRTRIRRVAGFWDIDIDIEVDGNLSVRDAHKIANGVESAIRRKLEAVYDIVVHIEPAGECDNEEAYGLSEDNLP